MHKYEVGLRVCSQSEQISKYDSIFSPKTYFKHIIRKQTHKNSRCNGLRYFKFCA